MELLRLDEQVTRRPPGAERSQEIAGRTNAALGTGRWRAGRRARRSSVPSGATAHVATVSRIETNGWSLFEAEHSSRRQTV